MADQKSVQMPMLDGTNFSAWKFRITVLLEEHELLECVRTNVADLEELVEKPGETGDAKTARLKLMEKRIKKDRHCRSLLVARIADAQLEDLHETKSPKDIWDKLHSIHARQSIASRMNIQRQIVMLRYGGGKMQEHLSKFERLIREYRAVGAKLEELDVIGHLLISMGTAYSGAVTALETQPKEELSYDFVKCRLLDEETKMTGMELPTPSQSDAAFYGAKPTKKPKCFGCGKEGHRVADCREKKQKAQGNKKKHNSKANVANSGDQKVCFVSEANPQKRESRWFVDSGATDHLVRDKELFSELHRLEKPIEIAVAKDGATIRAEHSGTVEVVAVVNGKRVNCSIKDALYVPKLRCNLFSVLRVEQAGMRVVFEDGKAKIYRGSEVVACAAVKNKLYEMNFLSPSDSDDSSLLTCGQLRKGFDLWHRRFGHLNGKSLKCLAQNGMVSGLDLKTAGSDDTFVCECCVVGKQTRKPFPPREDRRSSRVLELVHTDVCGPVTPEGLDGVKYFVTFIDDWSHFTMVYLIRSKDEVMERFEEYEAFVTAKFERPISRLKCDNGGEYRNKRFEKFCKQKGIRMEPTVPYTPELNPLSERMNRTLVEKARTMMVDSGVDKLFWGQAVQTAAYLTNRSPTAALETKQTPFELWESKKPNVSNIRIFGCEVFVHVPKELRRKLDDKAWKGTLVGYSHNGYRVWDPKKRSIVVARDVDFVEAVVEPKQVEHKQFEPSRSDDETSDDDVSSVDDEGESSDDEFNSAGEDPEPRPSPGKQGGGGKPKSTPGKEGAKQKRQTKPPAWHKDFDVEYASFALNAMNFIEDIPSSVTELKKRDDWHK